MTAEQGSFPPSWQVREWEVRVNCANGWVQRIPFYSDSRECLGIPLKLTHAIPTARVELWADDGRLFQAFLGGKTVEIGPERQDQLDRKREATAKAMAWRFSYELALMRNQPADPYDHGPGCAARISGKGDT